MRIGAEVYLWGSKIGTVVQNDIAGIPRFMYESNFIKSGIELSPVRMPLSSQTYSFPNLNEKTFHGLPGMLADSLPDKFGMKVIADYLARQGREMGNLTAVEKLCYIGRRGMGAIEYVPELGIKEFPDQSLDIDELSKLADRILSEREGLHITADEQAIGQLLKIGTSAGGARAKALIAWNEETKDIRSGQVDAGAGYGYWLLKFGEIKNNKDKDSEADGLEYPKIEYAYSLMARDAGIDMADCRLIRSEEGTHFMTKRFDREQDTGRKIHMQSLGGLTHYDFNEPGAHSYEQAVQVMRQIGLGQNAVEQLFRRMVFNEVAKNYDDHVKNISFLMDRRGNWSLSPAYDMTFSYNPNSYWTSGHQMKINGKKDGLEVEDLVACGKSMDISSKKIRTIIGQVGAVVREWPQYAEYVRLSEKEMMAIKGYHRYAGAFPDVDAELSMLEECRRKNADAYVKIA